MTDLEAEGTEGLVQEGEEGVGCPHCRHWRDAPGPRAYCLPSMGDTEGKICPCHPISPHTSGRVKSILFPVTSLISRERKGGDLVSCTNE